MATLLRDVPASAAYFGGYEILQRALTPEGGDRSQIGIARTLFAGQSLRNISKIQTKV
jgi:solute carrier family 25 carnitine/acylcarnitine transporter 20/29